MKPSFPKWLESEQRYDVGLTHTRNTPEVFWSPQGNSYILVEHTERPMNDAWFTERGEAVVYLTSVNGRGEVRWTVPHNGCTAGDREAADYFKLTPMEDSEWFSREELKMSNTEHARLNNLMRDFHAALEDEDTADVAAALAQYYERQVDRLNDSGIGADAYQTERAQKWMTIAAGFNA